MRYAQRAVALLSVLALAACSSGASAAWTYAPAPPSASPPPASASPSASAAASGSPEASGSGAVASGGSTVTIVASNATKYDTPQVSTAAGKPFTIVFDNQDATAPHNVVLQNPDGSPVKVSGDTAFFIGPGKRDYQVPALTAGSYPFHCAVHPNMTGTLAVQ